MDGTPSLSTTNLDSEDSVHDVVPLEHGSVSHPNVDDDFAQPNRNLNISDFDHQNISERPSSALEGQSGSSRKRGRVASVDARSLLGRPGLDDDRLCHLEEKIEEQEHQRVEMERQLKVHEDELKALQEKRDAEAKL